MKNIFKLLGLFFFAFFIQQSYAQSTIRLSNAVNATLGGQSIGTTTILDND